MARIYFLNDVTSAFWCCVLRVHIIKNFIKFAIVKNDELRTFCQSVVKNHFYWQKDRMEMFLVECEIVQFVWISA